MHVATLNRRQRRSIELALPAQERLMARRQLREAAGLLSTASSSGGSLTVNQYLRQPTTISRDLVNVILLRGGFLADRLLVRGSADQVAGGSMQYQRSGDSYLGDSEPEEIAEDGDWPRAGWTEELRQAAVKTYGLEVPISGLAIRRNQVDQISRATRRLANAIVKFVDSKAIEMLRTDADVQPANGGNWDDPTADIIGDVANAQELMDTLDEGLVGSVLVLPKTVRSNFLGNEDLRDALKGVNGSDSVRTGEIGNFLGLDSIYFTNQLPDDEALLVDPGVAGTIADEVPDAAEGWSSYNPGGAFAPIYVQVYEEKRPKRKIVAAGRWPAMALVEPRAVVHFTSTTT